MQTGVLFSFDEFMVSNVSDYTFACMAVKDYYLILGVKTGADVPAVKRAFRKLAMQYHPDKTGNSPANTHHFREIQEAYQTLSDPYKREQYLYTRWLEKSMGHQLDQALSADEILQLFLKAEQYLSQTDFYKTDKRLLYHQVLSTFSQMRLQTILEANNPVQINTTLQLAMRLCARLSVKQSMDLQLHFKNLLKQDEFSRMSWEKMILEQKQHASKEKWKLPMLLLITLAICLAIYWGSK
jgi:hypothetical protein